MSELRKHKGEASGAEESVTRRCAAYAQAAGKAVQHWNVECV